jgi:integrase
MLAHVVRRAGIDGKGISPHSLRHSFAIRALRRGGSVAALGGESNLREGTFGKASEAATRTPTRASGKKS